MSTLSEQILGAPAGEFVDRTVNRAYAHDGTGVLTLEAWRQMRTPLRDPGCLHIIFDHIVPANNSTTASLQAELREFAVSSGMHFAEMGSGICHQVMSEGYALPDEIVVGADSHTCTLGAFGAFATGVGATDLAAIWASGCTWFRVPETIAVHLTGTLQGAAEAKDVALACTSRLGMDGATYRALEFIGDGVESIPMSGRLTISNMAVESGAKTGLFYADEVTRRYLHLYGQDATLQKVEDAPYLRDLDLPLDSVPPLISVPHRVDTVKEAADLAGTPIDQVFVGTCTNGRYDDLRRFARMVKGRKVAVRTIVVPASRRVMERLTREGLLLDLLQAGCNIGVPGCGPCLGAHMGVIGEGEVCLSTANRNFKNRMGVGGEIYLGSVATAAVSAIAGEIRAPEADDVR